MSTEVALNYHLNMIDKRPRNNHKFCEEEVDLRMSNKNYLFLVLGRFPMSTE